MNPEPYPLTPRQQEVYDFLREYFGRNDQLPPSRTIQEKFGFASQTNATLHMQRIAKRGWIEKNEAGKWRFTRNQNT